MAATATSTTAAAGDDDQEGEEGRRQQLPGATLGHKHRRGWAGDWVEDGPVLESRRGRRHGQQQMHGDGVEEAEGGLQHQQRRQQLYAAWQVDFQAAQDLLRNMQADMQREVTGDANGRKRPQTEAEWAEEKERIRSLLYGGSTSRTAQAQAGPRGGDPQAEEGAEDQAASASPSGGGERRDVDVDESDHGQEARSWQQQVDDAADTMARLCLASEKDVPGLAGIADATGRLKRLMAQAADSSTGGSGSGGAAERDTASMLTEGNAADPLDRARTTLARSLTRIAEAAQNSEPPWVEPRWMWSVELRAKDLLGRGSAFSRVARDIDGRLEHIERLRASDMPQSDAQEQLLGWNAHWHHKLLAAVFVSPRRAAAVLVDIIRAVRQENKSARLRPEPFEFFLLCCAWERNLPLLRATIRLMQSERVQFSRKALLGISLCYFRTGQDRSLTQMLRVALDDGVYAVPPFDPEQLRTAAERGGLDDTARLRQEATHVPGIGPLFREPFTSWMLPNVGVGTRAWTSFGARDTLLLAGLLSPYILPLRSCARRTLCHMLPSDRLRHGMALMGAGDDEREQQQSNDEEVLVIDTPWLRSAAGDVFDILPMMGLARVGDSSGLESFVAAAMEWQSSTAVDQLESQSSDHTGPWHDFSDTFDMIQTYADILDEMLVLAKIFGHDPVGAHNLVQSLRGASAGTASTNPISSTPHSQFDSPSNSTPNDDASRSYTGGRYLTRGRSSLLCFHTLWLLLHSLSDGGHASLLDVYRDECAAFTSGWMSFRRAELQAFRVRGDTEAMAGLISYHEMLERGSRRPSACDYGIYICALIDKGRFAEALDVLGLVMPSRDVFMPPPFMATIVALFEAGQAPLFYLKQLEDIINSDILLAESGQTDGIVAGLRQTMDVTRARDWIESAATATATAAPH